MRLLLFTLSLLATANTFAIDAPAPREPTARERQICQAVTALLEREHINAQPMGDDLRRTLLDRYLDKLDPRKQYFLQVDVDEFRRQTGDMAGRLRRGDLTWFCAIHRRFRQRVSEGVRTTVALLDQKTIGNLPGEMSIDYAALPYAVDAEELQHRRRCRLQYELLTLCLPEENDARLKERLRRRYLRYLHQTNTIDHDDLLEVLLTVYANTLDPHTAYLSATTLSFFES